jgi:hypothetical protein
MNIQCSKTVSASGVEQSCVTTIKGFTSEDEKAIGKLLIDAGFTKAPQAAYQRAHLRRVEAGLPAMDAVLYPSSIVLTNIVLPGYEASEKNTSVTVAKTAAVPTPVMFEESAW